MSKHPRLLEQVKKTEFVEIQRWQDEDGRIFFRKEFFQGLDDRGWLDREARILHWMHSHDPYPRGMVRQRELKCDPAGRVDVIETYDAGIAVGTWSQVKLISPDGSTTFQNPFQYAWNWWTLMIALLDVFKELHKLGFVHVDLKSDNVCVPLRISETGRQIGGMRRHRKFRLDFDNLKLIDLTHALLADRPLSEPLPLGEDDRYQSRMLIQAIQADHASGAPREANRLDWRVDLHGLGQMMESLLPQRGAPAEWNDRLLSKAKALVRELKQFDKPGAPTPRGLPHERLWKKAVLGRGAISDRQAEWLTDVAGRDLLFPRQKRTGTSLTGLVVQLWQQAIQPRIRLPELSPAFLFKMLLMGSSIVILFLLLSRSQGW